MKERPILFSAPMVRALLDGSKNQTRRVVKMPKRFRFWVPLDFGGDFGGRAKCEIDEEGLHIEPLGRAVTVRTEGTYDVLPCPYGKPGDRLWVRETSIISPVDWTDMEHLSSTVTDRDGKKRAIQYLATAPDREAADDFKLKPTPSIFMPRWASRIDLEVTRVRVERLKGISEGDAIAEGWPKQIDPGAHTGGNGGPFDWYRAVWASINGERSWSKNPWVWVVEFKRVRQ